MHVTDDMARAAYDKWIEDVRDLEPTWDDLPASHKERLRSSIVAALTTAPPTPAPDAGERRRRAISLDGALECEAILIPTDPTPPPSGKVEAEAVASRHVVQELEGQKPVYSYNDPPLKGASERLYSEATVAAMQAEIERLTREAHVRDIDLQSARSRARAAEGQREAAEAELAKLREAVRRYLPKAVHGYTDCDRVCLCGLDDLRALLKGETE